MDALHQHPAEGGQEQIVQESGDRAAQGRVGGGVEPGQQQDLGQEEADAQLTVDGGALTTQTWE